MNEPIIQLKGVCKTYGGGSQTMSVLKDVDLEIYAGEFVAIVGTSGSGKSSLMNVMGLLDRASSGSYFLTGREVSKFNSDISSDWRRNRFGFVFQQYHLIQHYTAQQNVEVPATYAGLGQSERVVRSRALLEKLGLKHISQHRPTQMSGGQQQRVAIARALMNSPEIILADEPTGALDQSTGKEILQILQHLSAAGHTVVLITHDPEIAARADRQIRIEDGRIVSDSGTKNHRSPAPVSRNPDRRYSGGFLAREAFATAWISIAVNPFRTALTLLGVIIGVAAIISLLGIGRGAQISMMEQASALGTNWIMVGQNSSQSNISSPITPDDVLALKSLPNIEGAMPRFVEQATIKAGDLDLTTQVIGTDKDFEEVQKWGVSSGTFFTEEDQLTGAAVVLIGTKVATRLFPGDRNAVGQNILINNTSFSIIGVLEAKGASENGEDRDDTVVMPLQTAQTRVFGGGSIALIVASIIDMAQYDATAAKIKSVLTRRHGREDFWMYDSSAALQKANDTRRNLNFLLAAVGGISLLVGGIGIMNIMLVSVKERTREIGVRMAVGARRTDISRQFLIEAAILSGAGGITGLAIGAAIGIVAAIAFQATVVFSATVWIAALSISLLLGLLFGYAPARRASHLSPVDALSGA